MAKKKSRVRTLAQFLVEEGRERVLVYAANEYDARIQALDIFNSRSLGTFRTHMKQSI